MGIHIVQYCKSNKNLRQYNLQVFNDLKERRKSSIPSQWKIFPLHTSILKQLFHFIILLLAMYVFTVVFISHHSLSCHSQCKQQHQESPQQFFSFLHMLSFLQAHFTLNQQHLVCTCSLFKKNREDKTTSWKTRIKLSSLFYMNCRLMS